METTTGGGVVTLERLQGLVNNHNVTVFTTHADEHARKYFATVKWKVAGKRRLRNSAILLQSFINRLPLSVWRNTTPEGLHAADALSGTTWDLVYVDHWLMIEAALRIKSSNRILHLHNAEPEVFFRAAKSARFPYRLVMWGEGHRSTTYLREVVPKFDGLHLLSGDDAAALRLRKIDHPNTTVFLPAAAQPKVHPADISGRRNEVLFVGTLSWHANEEGLLWYLKNVLPQTDSGLRHQIVGGGSSRRLLAALEEAAGVVAHGYVDDLEPFYQTARCLVAPLLSGSGIKIKIVNALARGLPVVTTRIGIEGFPPGYKSAISVAETPAAFSKAIEKFCGDPIFWRCASEEANSYFKAHFTGRQWQKWAEELSP